MSNIHEHPYKHTYIHTHTLIHYTHHVQRECERGLVQQLVPRAHGAVLDLHLRACVMVGCMDGWMGGREGVEVSEWDENDMKVRLPVCSTSVSECCEVKETAYTYSYIARLEGEGVDTQ